MRLNYFARSVLFLAHCAVDVDWVPIDVTFSQFDFLSVRNEFSQCHKRKLEPRAAMMSAEPPRRTNRIEIEPGCRIGHELLNNLHSKWFNWTTVAIKLDMKINRQFPVGCTPRMRSEMEMKRLADEWTRMRRHWERQTNMIDCLMFIVYLRGHTLLTYRCMAAFDVSLGSYYVCAFEAFNAWVGGRIAFCTQNAHIYLANVLWMNVRPSGYIPDFNIAIFVGFVLISWLVSSWQTSTVRCRMLRKWSNENVARTSNQNVARSDSIDSRSIIQLNRS